MIKIGAITVGQSPRTDVTMDIRPILGPDVELLEVGALDGLGPEELRAMEPQRDDYVLVSRLRDGTSVRFAERCILPRIQTAIRQLTKQGAQMILMLCTGEFPESLHTEIPLVYPCRLLESLVPALADNGRIGVVVPDVSQKPQALRHWNGRAAEVHVAAASPYDGENGFQAAAAELKSLDLDLIILDCIGYTVSMKRMLRQATGKPVLLPRTVLARVVRELIDGGDAL